MHKLAGIGLAVLTIVVTGCAATAVGVGAGAGVASASDTRGFSTVVSDQTLEHKVNSVLGAQVPNGSFTVASYAAQVLVAGQVSNEADYDKVNNAVTNTQGVKKVWNYVTVGSKETLGDMSQDAYLTSAAKTRLIGQKEVNTNNIKVVTCAGVVYLLGNNAGKRHQVTAAIRGIKQIKGVKGVVNLIQF